MKWDAVTTQSLLLNISWCSGKYVGHIQQSAIVIKLKFVYKRDAALHNGGRKKLGEGREREKRKEKEKLRMEEEKNWEKTEKEKNKKRKKN